ncbi:unnamed protein product [Soboliphyme baturini]|uniref:Calponin-homology (CH) domain-containing protein n=1 Tax=Soboliphyme baturini TaxID=241478 RepID=A0A183J4C6_9BILA|nr:unnamed protein product [Soboliphyme baturini]
MSPYYESAWTVLSQAFSRPINFSYQCDQPYDQKGIGMVDCPSICIKMWEDNNLLGNHLEMWKTLCDVCACLCDPKRIAIVEIDRRTEAVQL